MSHTWPQSRPDLQTVGVTWRLPVGDQQPTRSVTTSLPSGLSECSDYGCVLAGPDPATHRGSSHRPHLHTTWDFIRCLQRLGAPALPPSPTFVQLPALSLPLVGGPQPEEEGEEGSPVLSPCSCPHLPWGPVTMLGCLTQGSWLCFVERGSRGQSHTVAPALSGRFQHPRFWRDLGLPGGSLLAGGWAGLSE